jgi:hypothetical protein
MCKPLSVASFAALLIVAAACAQQLISPEQDQAARLLFRYVWLRGEMLNAALDSGMSAVEPSLDELARFIERHGGPLTSGERDAINRAVRRVLEEAFLSREFEDSAARIYGTRFSEDELRQVLDWYRTPLGDKVLRETRAMNAEFQEAGSRLGGSESMKRRLMRDVRAALPTRKIPE